MFAYRKTVTEGEGYPTFKCTQLDIGATVASKHSPVSFHHFTKNSKDFKYDQQQPSIKMFFSSHNDDGQFIMVLIQKTHSGPPITKAEKYLKNMIKCVSLRMGSTETKMSKTRK